MEYREENLRSEKERIIEDLDRLRQFTGPPGEFWPAFLESSGRLAGAWPGLRLVRDEEASSWKNLCEWSDGGRRIGKVSSLTSRAKEIAQASAQQGYAYEGDRTSMGREGRYTPEVGAQCISSACWDLGGGCRVTGIPTATKILRNSFN